VGGILPLRLLESIALRGGGDGASVRPRQGLRYMSHLFEEEIGSLYRQQECHVEQTRHNHNLWQRGCDWHAHRRLGPTHSACSDVRLAHFSGSAPPIVLLVMLAARSESMPSAHWSGRLPPIRLSATSLRRAWAERSGGFQTQPWLRGCQSGIRGWESAEFRVVAAAEQ
jgi:hypothetical protein